MGIEIFKENGEVLVTSKYSPLTVIFIIIR